MSDQIQPYMFDFIPEPDPADQFTLGGIELNRIPLEDPTLTNTCIPCLSQDYIQPNKNTSLDEDTESFAEFKNFEITNTAETWQAEAFGVKLNDRDDVFTVGIVLLIVFVTYVLKVSIDHWFNCRLERYKKQLNKE